VKDLPSNERRVDVAKAIEPLLQDGDGFTRSDAAKALGHWGGPENTPALTAALRDPAFNVRWAVLDELRDLKYPTSAPALAELLASGDRHKASEALRAIGPEAEPSVLPYLRNGDSQVRREACKILEVIGTEMSVPDLIAMARSTGLDSMAARSALNGMARRDVNTSVPLRRKTRGR
jgi:HEAT repeat protein